MSKETVEMYLGKCKFSAHQIEQLEDVACCKAMFHDLIDNVFQYDEIRNCISVFITTVNRIYLDSKKRVPKKETHIMTYCPTCGAKLPDYSDEYNEALEEEMRNLGITYDDLDEGKAKIPEEFLSDAWWKNRGIHGLGHWWNNFSPVRWQRPFVDKD